MNYQCKRDGRCPMCSPTLAAVMRMDSRQYGEWLAKTQQELRGAAQGEERAPDPPSLSARIRARALTGQP